MNAISGSTLVWETTLAARHFNVEQTHSSLLIGRFRSSKTENASANESICLVDLVRSILLSAQRVMSF